MASILRQVKQSGPKEVVRRLTADPWLSVVATTPGMISMEEAVALHDLAASVEGGVIVEVGSYRGRSSIALAYGARHGHGAPVYAIDPHEPFAGVYGGRFGPKDRAAFYRAMLLSGAYREVRLVNLSSEVVSPGWTRPIGLLWIDGDHTEPGVRRDVDSWLPYCVAGALVAFDDSTDTEGGPAKVIAAEKESGRLALERVVGKISVCRLLDAAAGEAAAGARAARLGQ